MTKPSVDGFTVEHGVTISPNRFDTLQHHEDRMLEIFGDLWKLNVPLRCIPTNGTVKRDGNAVMGKGIALQAKERFPGVEQELGSLLRSKGNHVHELSHGLVSFPTKREWWEDSSIPLIEQSARELVMLADQRGWKRVGLPQPGTGNGNLPWTQVQLILSQILDSRFIVCSLESST